MAKAERQARPLKLPVAPIAETAAVDPVTLARVVENLGVGVAEVLAAPRGLDVPVRDVVIHDPVDPPHIERDDILLAVGVRAGERESFDLVGRAGSGNAAAVAFKTPEGIPARLIELADASGVAILGIPSEIMWSQMHSLLRTAMASAGQAPDLGGSGGQPFGELFALANAISAMVGGPVTIEDPQSRVLAYSSLDEPLDEPRRQTILGRRVPEDWLRILRDRGVFRELWTSRDVVRVDGLGSKDEVRPRLAIAVHAGSEILGSIWVAQGRKPFSANDEDALRHAAQISALHLVRHRVGEDLERRMRGELLRALLEGRGPLKTLASRLGLDADGHFAVVAFELPAVDDVKIALLRERMLELVSVYCDAFRRRSVQVAIGPVVYALLPIARQDKGEGIIRLAAGVTDGAASSLSVPVRVGIGSTVDHLRDAARSRAEADLVLRVMIDKPNLRMAHIDDVRAQSFLLELRDFAEARPQMAKGRLQLLIDHDQQHGTSYVDTLRAHLDHFGDIPTAADKIGVHANTFRYRMRRLSEIAGIDLEDPDERLAAQLQLRLI